MRTPIDYAMDYISSEVDLRILIEQIQQEAYEEGRKDGYAACKSDYATQITYNK